MQRACSLLSTVQHRTLPLETAILCSPTLHLGRSAKIPGGPERGRVGSVATGNGVDVANTYRSESARRAFPFLLWAENSKSCEASYTQRIPPGQHQQTKGENAWRRREGRQFDSICKPAPQTKQNYKTKQGRMMVRKARRRTSNMGEAQSQAELVRYTQNGCFQEFDCKSLSGSITGNMHVHWQAQHSPIQKNNSIDTSNRRVQLQERKLLEWEQLSAFSSSPHCTQKVFKKKRRETTKE
ncbi:hypothetical protein BaRGS_00001021 [Batillaria attramentaria]|uniref:Uncharacterized protein n=1 Tax=Batillaria attramentaria TaxID=370345 RepID=A0ABD0M9I6_9CAEN